jgi:hypothetical protein
MLMLVKVKGIMTPMATVADTGYGVDVYIYSSICYLYVYKELQKIWSFYETQNSSCVFHSFLIFFIMCEKFNDLLFMDRSSVCCAVQSPSSVM